MLRRRLGPFDSVMMMVGLVIGSGIYLTTGIMADTLPSVPLIMAAWLVGGLLTLAGALTCAELGALLPEAGGLYVFLREAWGSLAGFLFGWLLFLVTMSGSVAALAVAFAEYLGRFLPALSPERTLLTIIPGGAGGAGGWSISAGQLAAVGLIVVLTAYNYRGVRPGAVLQNVLTVIKIGTLVALGVIGLSFGRAEPVDLALNPAGLGLSDLLTGFGVALIAVSWAFDGWNNITYVAGEIRDPGRNLPLALIGGTLLITLLYLLANAVFVRALPLGEMAGVVPVAERAVSSLFGRAAGGVLTVLVLVSILGALQGAVFAGPRVFYAMARDGFFFRRVGGVHPRFGTPAAAIVLQGAWSIVLTLSGTFEQLFTFVMFLTIAFWIAAAAAVFTLRRTMPDAPRPYRTWGYPAVPILFILASLALMVNTLINRPLESLAGIGLALVGLPVYAWWRKQRQQALSSLGLQPDTDIPQNGENPDAAQ